MSKCILQRGSDLHSRSKAAHTYVVYTALYMQELVLTFRIWRPVLEARCSLCASETSGSSGRAFTTCASNVTKLLPLADRILVRRLVPKAQTAGGVYLPETKASKVNEGEVVAVGPGRVTEAGAIVAVNVAIGDKVLLPEYGGQTVSLHGEDLTLVREDDILGKFSD
eukprot:8243-Heterococcus_DN1.PRE.2